ncbi:putative nucleotidyltransferase, ribonuclease H [Tanacetum coccineum]
MDVHDNDTSESSKPSWGEMCTLVTMSTFKDQKNSEDIFSIESALNDAIFVVFILVRNIFTHAITTRSRLNYKPPKNPFEDNTISQDNPVTKETITRNNKETPDVESYTPAIPFPGRLKKEKEKEKFIKFFENLQQLNINIPFVEALEQMPKYAKCYAILLNKIPLKEKDPGSFTIPCVLGKIGIDKALADLGASISLMLYSMFARGIAKNVIVKVDKFIFPVDMVVLDMEDHKISIILGRPFLATAHAMIDVFNKKISFEVGNETITFDIENSMKFSMPEDDTCLSINMVDAAVLDHGDKNDEIEHNLDELNKSGLSFDQDGWEPNDFIKPILFTASTCKAEAQLPKLKELPSHLNTPS